MTSSSIAELNSAALAWFDLHGRDLAFRRTTDPWAVLVSEVMAQQTQAERAAEAWAAFIDRYPTPAALAAAPVADVIRAWRGLGYNRRAVALHAAAIRMVEIHEGRVPATLDALIELPGIGSYTARAVLAIAFDQPVAALDTNIRRVLGRSISGLPVAARAVQEAADSLVPPGRAAAWTHALMDIGATFCRNRGPRCGECPLARSCASLRAGGPLRPNAIPAPPRKPAPRFESTTRWLRGRILDRLRDAPGGTWSSFDGPIGRHQPDAVAAALQALETEGFLERDRTDAARARLVAD
jgi:A/G-specific adenine glycosylase